MGKSVYIAEKPSVAQEFAKALHTDFKRKDGYLEADNHIVTWCVGHLVTMSYPDAYDEKLKRWSFDTLPFIPQTFKYEVIPAVQKQFDIVKEILNRADVDTIYVCTDSGREGEYIYRLVRQEAKVKDKQERRVWIDSQTEEEILKGINTAKDISEYDNLSDAAYLRAKEDYLMGINFSRVLTLKYGRNIASYLHLDRAVVSVGRVMTCVLGMVVRREREIRSFVKTPFYRVIGTADINEHTFDAEWRVCEASRYYNTPYLYKDNGFKDKDKARELVDILSEPLPAEGIVKEASRKKETKNPPLLYDLAEVQNVVDVTFPHMTKTIDEFASGAAAKFGLSETMAKKFTGTFGSMAEAFGFSEKQAADMATTLTGLAGDVASFYNISQDEAYTKLKSVFSGETETLKDLGIVMTQSALDAYALANGYGKVTSKMTEAEKVSLRYAFVQSQLTNAAGDFASTSDSWANQVRLLSLQFDSLRASIGQGLINVLTPVIKWLNVLIGKLAQAAKAFASFTSLFSKKKSSGAGAAASAVASNISKAATSASNLGTSAGKSSSGLSKAAKAAKKLKRELAGFDQITKLGDEDSDTDAGSSGGSGGSGSSAWG